MSNKFYEQFHKKTKVQVRLITDKDFTYQTVLSVVNKYCKSGKKVLDIGCGAGNIDLYLAEKGCRVTGIDISRNAIAAAKESAKILGLEKKTTFTVFTFPDQTPKGTYDVVICSEVLEHLQNDTLAVSKIYKLLKSKGVAIFSVPSENAPLHRLGLAKSFDRRVGHVRRYTASKLVRLVQQSGFTVTETRTSEGVLRNFLFVIPYAGKLMFFLRFFLVDIFVFLDNISLKLFGESQIFVVAQKK